MEIQVKNSKGEVMGTFPTDGLIQELRAALSPPPGVEAVLAEERTSRAAESQAWAQKVAQLEETVGQLQSDEHVREVQAAFEDHLKSCPDCRAVVLAELTAVDAKPEAVATALAAQPDNHAGRRYLPLTGEWVKAA